MSGADDQRWAAVQEQITLLASGHLDARMPATGGRDELEAVAVGLNMLGEQLQTQAESVDRAEGLLQDALDLYENAPAMFASIGRDLRVVKCNQTLAETLGLHKQAILGSHVRTLSPPEAWDGVEQCFNTFLETGAHPPLEVSLQAASGERVVTQLSLKAIRDERGTIVRCQVVWTDGRPRKAMEARLQQSQRLEALGRLVGGVAHDLNNLLTVVMGGTALARYALPEEHPACEELDDAMGATVRAAELVERLMAYARQQRVEPHAVDLCDLLDGVTRLLRKSAGEGFTVTVERPAGPIVVMGDTVQLEQILVNLVVNARDAMPDGGEVRVVAGLLAEQGRARITVTDQGEGMDAQTRERAFEPFFTTKPVGRGTGLGLAMAYGIITRLGGDIAIASELGEGTAVTLALPLAAAEEARGVARAGRSVGAGRCVLLVEDRPVVRQITADVLRRKGFKVLEAESAAVAVVMAGDGGRTIDALLTNVAMPGMSGHQLVERFRQLKPTAGVVCATNSELEQLEGLGCVYLPKPWSAPQLLQAVLAACADRRPTGAS